MFSGSYTGVWGFGFRGFRVWGLGLRVSGLGFLGFPGLRVCGLGFRGFGFRV